MKIDFIIPTIFRNEDELNRALVEDGSSTSTYIAPKVYFPGV